MVWIGRGLLALIVLVLAVGAGGWAWLRTSVPEWQGEVRAKGLAGPVEVIRDRDGIPHVFAATTADGMLALGYIHAQDRLYQMEMMRRAAAGRLAEVTTADAVGADRFFRTLAVYRLAESGLERMAPENRRLLAAYTAGVNAFLENHAGAWPPEFYLLGIEPEPWRAADTLVWGRLMALRLSGNWREEALRARLVQDLGAERAERLWPPQGAEAATTLAAEGPLEELPFEALAAVVPEWLRWRGASNEWVVDGRHTATGRPILANDPHLGFSAPGLWYLARLVTPERTLAGGTVPGVPLFVLGRNDRIAWGFTTTNSDVADLVIVRVDPDDPGRYLTPEGAEPFLIREETFSIRGGASETATVRETRYGPVVSDLADDLSEALGPGRVVALKATFLDPDDRTAEGLLGINAAEDWESFVAALRLFRVPQQNIAYADIDGNIGFFAPAHVPIRASGDGRLPAEAESGGGDWLGEVPFDALPQGLNPPTGRFVNANNRVVPDDYPYFLGRDWEAPYRAERIEALLDAGGKQDLESSARIQADIVSLAARDLVPLLTAIEPEEARAKRALALLRAWDGRMARDRPEPLIFAAWLRELNRHLFADELGDRFRRFWGLKAMLARAVLGGDTEWCDDVTTGDVAEDCAGTLERALMAALAWIEERHGAAMAEWRWGDAHQAEFRHRVFDWIPVLRDFASIRLPTDGGFYTVNRGAHWVADERAPFAHRHGAGYRAIYDMAAPDRSRFMVATGPCGNPLCPDYDAFTRRWRDFEYVTLAGERDALAASGAGTLRLLPAE